MEEKEIRDKKERGAYFMEGRRQRKQELLQMILSNKELPRTNIIGLFSLKTGLRATLIEKYWEELRMAGLLEESNKVVEGKALKIIEEEKNAQAAEARQRAELEKVDKEKAARKNQLIEDISSHRRVIVRITEELLDDKVKEEDKGWKRDNLEKAKIVLNRLEKELEEFDKE